MSTLNAYSKVRDFVIKHRLIILGISSFALPPLVIPFLCFLGLDLWRKFKNRPQGTHYTKYLPLYPLLSDVYGNEITENELREALHDAASHDAKLTKNQVRGIFATLLDEHHKLVQLGLNADEIFGALEDVFPNLPSKLDYSEYNDEKGEYKERGTFCGEPFDIRLTPGDELIFIDTFVKRLIEKNTDSTLVFESPTSDSYIFLIVPKGREQAAARLMKFL